MKTRQTLKLVRRGPASVDSFVRGVKHFQFASEMSCQAAQTCRWLNLSPCFVMAEVEIPGKALVKSHLSLQLREVLQLIILSKF